MKDLDKETVKRASGEFILQEATANIHVYNLCLFLCVAQFGDHKKRFKNIYILLLHLILISRLSFKNANII